MQLFLPKEFGQITGGGLTLAVSIHFLLCFCTPQKSVRYFLVSSAGRKAGSLSCVCPLKYRKGRSKVKVDFETVCIVIEAKKPRSMGNSERCSLRCKMSGPFSFK